MFSARIRIALLLLVVMQSIGCASIDDPSPYVSGTERAIQYVAYPGDSGFYFPADETLKSRYFRHGIHVVHEVIDCSDQTFVCLNTNEFEIAVPRHGFTSRTYVHHGYSYFVSDVFEFQVLGKRFSGRRITQATGITVATSTDPANEADIVAQFVFTEERGLLAMTLVRELKSGLPGASWWLEGEIGLLAKQVERVRPTPP